tara:strand:+ start:91 stop:195 length:105 start_codon:yes stop_codon:yes gene_type:complete
LREKCGKEGIYYLPEMLEEQLKKLKDKINSQDIL